MDEVVAPALEADGPTVEIEADRFEGAFGIRRHRDQVEGTRDRLGLDERRAGRMDRRLALRLDEAEQRLAGPLPGPVELAAPGVVEAVAARIEVGREIPAESEEGSRGDVGGRLPALDAVQ